ncbi:hypothetical protein NL676_000107 [Syzygium grande]|nr:hypothetical protein NL676_000107 [Syzygium grande]
MAKELARQEKEKYEAAKKELELMRGFIEREALRRKAAETSRLEILSKIGHPHLLLLIDACPDHGCLIYEYMENGSLEDRLLRKNSTPPIPWFDRFRIAWEVASALVFLHNVKPKPIIHRDLKPAKILLDNMLNLCHEFEPAFLFG